MKVFPKVTGAVIGLVLLSVGIWAAAKYGSLFSTNYMPHAHCYLLEPGLIWTNAVSDGLIWLSYVAIAISLVMLRQKTRNLLPFQWVFVAFGLFIVACGFSHFFEVITLWIPLYWLSTTVKMLTAAASVVTAVAFAPLVSRAVEAIRLYQQEQHEQAARQAQRYLSAIIESSNDAIVGKTLDGTITSWNPAAERLYGYSAAEAVGQPISLLLPTEHPDDIVDIMQRVANRERINCEAIRRRKDGSLVEVSLRISPILDGSGNVVGASTIAHDITEQKRVQEALLRSEKLAATGRLAATIAHEINNPLAGATNAVYLASCDSGLTEQGKNALALADQELRRAAHITHQTLGFYREHSREQLSLPKLVDEMLLVYATKLRNRNITVQRRYHCAIASRRGGCPDGCERCEKGCFLVNAGELRQIISNLLANGIDALSDGGSMQIRVLRLPHRIQLIIADNGSGIRTENLKRIFEPFFTTKEAYGTGLGLWITQELVRKHNGVIKVRSRKDRGTVFRLTFPSETAFEGDSGGASSTSLAKSA